MLNVSKIQWAEWKGDHSINKFNTIFAICKAGAIPQYIDLLNNYIHLPSGIDYKLYHVFRLHIDAVS